MQQYAVDILVFAWYVTMMIPTLRRSLPLCLLKLKQAYLCLLMLYPSKELTLVLVIRGVVSEREISFVAAYDGCTLTLMFYCYCSAAIA